MIYNIMKDITRVDCKIKFPISRGVYNQATQVEGKGQNIQKGCVEEFFDLNNNGIWNGLPKNMVKASTLITSKYLLST